MKKLLFLFAFLMANQLAFGQIYANGIVLDTTKAGQYLVVKAKYKKKEFFFTLEYASHKGETTLTDAKGETLVFDSIVTGFDFFYEHGWEFSTTITDVSGINGIATSTSICVFQRRK